MYCEASVEAQTCVNQCLIYTIFALGCQWAPLEQPIEPNKVITTPKSNTKGPGPVFYEHVRALLPVLIESSTTTAIQALFMLAIYYFPINTVSTANMYLGLALSLS